MTASQFLTRALAWFSRAVLLVIAVGRLAGAETTYDPLAIDAGQKPETREFTVHDSARERDIPLLVYLPPKTAPAPMILFSHGLGGSRHGYAYLGQHWAARGYVVVMIQHGGSDEAVWRGKSPSEARAAMKAAVTVQNWRLRAGDVHAVISQLEIWNKAAGNPLEGRMELAHLGMAGHSFGSSTALTAGGQSLPRVGTGERDERVRAAVGMSPGPSPDGNNEKAFGGVAIPWMLMTGTDDGSPFGLGSVKPESRLAVYEALPAGGSYQIVLKGAEHGAFCDGQLPGEHEQNPEHHRAILALTTAFFDANLRADPAAKAWLNSPAPRTTLNPADRYDRK